MVVVKVGNEFLCGCSKGGECVFVGVNNESGSTHTLSCTEYQSASEPAASRRSKFVQNSAVFERGCA